MVEMAWTLSVHEINVLLQDRHKSREASNFESGLCPCAADRTSSMTFGATIPKEQFTHWD